jgi:hypothetical protein
MEGVSWSRARIVGVTLAKITSAVRGIDERRFSPDF